MSVCDYDLISRVALADVSGHGHDVSAATQTLRPLVHKNINLLGPAGGPSATRGTRFVGDGDRYTLVTLVLTFDQLGRQHQKQRTTNFLRQLEPGLFDYGIHRPDILGNSQQFVDDGSGGLQQFGPQCNRTKIILVSD